MLSLLTNRLTGSIPIPWRGTSSWLLVLTDCLPTPLLKSFTPILDLTHKTASSQTANSMVPTMPMSCNSLLSFVVLSKFPAPNCWARRGFHCDGSSFSTRFFHNLVQSNTSIPKSSIVDSRALSRKLVSSLS